MVLSDVWVVFPDDDEEKEDDEVPQDEEVDLDLDFISEYINGGAVGLRETTDIFSVEHFWKGLKFEIEG